MSKCVLHFKNESIKKDWKVWAFKDTHLTYIEIHSRGTVDAVSWFHCGR